MYVVQNTPYRHEQTSHERAKRKGREKAGHRRANWLPADSPPAGYFAVKPTSRVQH